MAWIRYASAENIKRELTRELHTNFEENFVGRGGHLNLVRQASLQVKFILFDSQKNLSIQSCFPTQFPTVSLSWHDLFPGENPDDCHALAEVERTDVHLVVKHWKFVYGLEIEHQYKISLNRVSPSLARDIKATRGYDSSIPHTHEVKIEGVQTFSRPNHVDRNRRGDSNHASSLESTGCLGCESVFLKRLGSTEKCCAKCG